MFFWFYNRCAILLSWSYVLCLWYPWYLVYVGRILALCKPFIICFVCCVVCGCGGALFNLNGVLQLHHAWERGKGVRIVTYCVPPTVLLLYDKRAFISFAAGAGLLSSLSTLSVCMACFLGGEFVRTLVALCDPCVVVIFVVFFLSSWCSLSARLWLQICFTVHVMRMFVMIRVRQCSFDDAVQGARAVFLCTYRYHSRYDPPNIRGRFWSHRFTGDSNYI